MKKHIVLSFTALLILTSQLHAQMSGSSSREKFQLGIKGGLNYANVYNTKTENFTADAKLGLVAGGLFRIPITRDIGFQPEILISQRGFKGSGTLLGSPYSFSRTSTYIDIPLQVALRPTDFLSLLIGPQYGYLIKQKDVFTNSITSFAQEEVFKNDNIRKNTLGIVMGADLMFDHLVIGGRIGWDLLNNKGDGTSSTPTYRNTWIQGTIGYAFFRD